MKMPTKMYYRENIRRGMSTFLLILALARQAASCDFCLTLPRVPFECDHAAAIEVALATRAAAGLREINLNPEVRFTDSNDRCWTTLLSEISPRQLISQWVRTRPAASVRSLRCTLELILVDVDHSILLDIRFGEILAGDPRHGVADVRLMTTKAGFCRLLQDGLIACERRQWVAIEALRPVDLDDLQRLFESRQAGQFESVPMDNNHFGVSLGAIMVP